MALQGTIVPSRARRDKREATLDPTLEWVARLMDSAFHVPGLDIRFGLDPIIGLIPGFGDALGCLISLYILAAARRYGVPRATMGRMAANILIDYLIGVVPVIGDALDVFWKSNQKNVNLLRRHFEATPAESHRRVWADRLFVAGLIGGLLALIAVSLLLAYWLLAALDRSIRAMAH